MDQEIVTSESKLGIANDHAPTELGYVFCVVVGGFSVCRDLGLRPLRPLTTHRINKTERIFTFGLRRVTGNRFLRISKTQRQNKTKNGREGIFDEFH